jgi:hypothetical protein
VEGQDAYIASFAPTGEIRRLGSIIVPSTTGNDNSNKSWEGRGGFTIAGAVFEVLGIRSQTLTFVSSSDRGMTLIDKADYSKFRNTPRWKFGPSVSLISTSMDISPDGPDTAPVGDTQVDTAMICGPSSSFITCTWYDAGAYRPCIITLK